MKKENNLIDKEKKIIRIEGEEIKNSMEAINRLYLSIGEKIFCSRCGIEGKIVLASLQGDLDNLRQINICQDCWSFKLFEEFVGKEQAEKMRKEWENKLKRLVLNPLSVAKYFYEQRKVSDPVIMQRLIYFAYLEILKEENIILFEENFQAWPGGPVLESVIYPMYENCEELKSFFDKIIKVDNKLVTNYLERIANKYLKLKNSQISKEARNKLWSESLDDKRDDNPINETNLFFFIQANKNQPLSLLPR